MHIKKDSRFTVNMTGFEDFSVVPRKFSLYLITQYRSIRRNRCFGGEISAILSPCSVLVYCLAYSSILKMEEIGSTETSVDSYGTIRIIPHK